MKQIQPSQLRSNADYAIDRDAFRARIMAVKALRRIHVGEHLTFLFENTDTMLYQVQEMMRVENIVDPKAIAHELKTYNEIVPGQDELSATLLIEYATPEERDPALRALLGLQDHVSIHVEGAGEVGALFDDRQIAEERISSVHYISFPLGGELANAIRGGAAISIRVTHPAMTIDANLTSEQHAALVEDLSD